MTGDCVDLCDLAVLVGFKFADSGSKDLGADQGGQTAYHVDSSGAGEIVEAQLSQPAAAPDPVCFHRVDQSGDHAGVYTVGQELGTLCHCAGNDGCGGCAEYQVEYKVGVVKVFVCGEDIQTRLTDQTYHILPQE